MQPFFTLHGVEHSAQVERIVEDVLGAEYRPVKGLLKAEEAFYLLAAVWLHDVGMVDEPTPEEESKATALGLPVSDWIREVHHERSYRYIIEHYAELGVERHEAVFIASVARAHRGGRVSADPDLTNDFPDTRFLAAVLRIADELDISAARAPAERLEQLWPRMDEVSRWHWLKHFCIPHAAPFHQEEVRGNRSRLLKLAYTCTVRLPVYGYLDSFRTRVMAPIWEVLHRQDVDLVLREKGLTVEPDYFRFNAQPDRQILPERIGGAENAALLRFFVTTTPRMEDPLDRALGRNTERNPGVGQMLRSQYQTVAAASRYVPNATDWLPVSLEHYLEALARVTDLGSLLEAERVFTEACRRFLRGGARPGTPSEELELGCLSFARNGYYAVGYLIGHLTDNVALRRTHLRHLCRSQDGGANALFRWVALNDPDASIRAESVRSIVPDGLTETAQTLLAATKDADSEVRRQAVLAIRTVPDPELRERLTQILDYEVDSTVREAARDVLLGVAGNPVMMEPLLAGRKVLILDDERRVVPPLVDALKSRGIDAVVATRLDKLRWALDGPAPDVVVFDPLIPYEFTRAANLPPDGTLPGTALIDEVRRRLPEVPVLASSVLWPEEIAGLLERVRCVYIRKHVPTEIYVRTIESLLAAPLSSVKPQATSGTV